MNIKLLIVAISLLLLSSCSQYDVVSVRYVNGFQKCTSAILETLEDVDDLRNSDTISESSAKSIASNITRIRNLQNNWSSGRNISITVYRKLPKGTKFELRQYIAEFLEYYGKYSNKKALYGLKIDDPLFKELFSFTKEFDEMLKEIQSHKTN